MGKYNWEDLKNSADACIQQEALAIEKVDRFLGKLSDIDIPAMDTTYINSLLDNILQSPNMNKIYAGKIRQIITANAAIYITDSVKIINNNKNLFNQYIENPESDTDSQIDLLFNNILSAIKGEQKILMKYKTAIDEIAKLPVPSDSNSGLVPNEPTKKTK
jgi:hypothetical protein